MSRRSAGRQLEREAAADGLETLLWGKYGARLSFVSPTVIPLREPIALCHHEPPADAGRAPQLHVFEARLRAFLPDGGSISQQALRYRFEVGHGSLRWRTPRGIEVSYGGLTQSDTSAVLPASGVVLRATGTRCRLLLEQATDEGGPITVDQLDIEASLALLPGHAPNEPNIWPRALPAFGDPIALTPGIEIPTGAREMRVQSWAAGAINIRLYALNSTTVLYEQAVAYYNDWKQIPTDAAYWSTRFAGQNDPVLAEFR